MGLFDLIRELRTGEPNLKKAAKTLKYLGWGCILGGLWNFVLPQIMPFKETGFSLPTYYPILALIGFSIIGALFLISARGTLEMEPWGKKAGQIAIILLIFEILLFSAFVMPEFTQFPSTDRPFNFMFYIFFAIVMAQFVVPAYFGFRYLGRLPTKSDPCCSVHFNSNEISHSHSERITDGVTNLYPEMKYKDSPVPFGIVGTFPLLIAVPLLGMIIGQKYVGPESMALLFPFVFLFIFLGPTSFNYFSSPFQNNRKLVTSFTGGGSIFLLHGSWPFFRLLVYENALEVRFMFHRFLIPYEKMDDIHDKIGFFTTGILIKSDLPDVPSSIRFSGFGMKKIVQIINETRNRYLSASQKK